MSQPDHEKKIGKHLATNDPEGALDTINQRLLALETERNTLT